MNRVALIMDAGVSHFYASMGVARRFLKLGYCVEYWGTSKMQKTVLDHGFEFREIQGMWPRFPEEIRRSFQLKGWRLLFHPVLAAKNLARRRCWLKRLSSSLDQF